MKTPFLSPRRLAFAAIIGIVGCVGTAVPPALAADQTIDIAITVGGFQPAEIAANSHDRIKFVVKNDTKANSEFESSDFHREKVVTAGKSITVFVGPLDAGKYEFFDDFHPERRGHLTVK